MCNCQPVRTDPARDTAVRCTVKILAVADEMIGTLFV
jgi:hypothetical protein